MVITPFKVSDSLDLSLEQKCRIGRTIARISGDV